MSAAVIFSTLGMAAFALANPLIGLSARQLGHPAFITGCSTPHAQLSCHNTTIQENTCCFENPGVSHLCFLDYPFAGADDVRCCRA